MTFSGSTNYKALIAYCNSGTSDSDVENAKQRLKDAQRRIEDREDRLEDEEDDFRRECK